MLWRAWRLRCPRCGQQRLFKNWITMYPQCATCHLKYEREPGYFLGSIYINYGLTAVLVTILYFTIFFTKVTTHEIGLGLVMAIGAVFAIWFFRYARSLWLGFDHFWDPTVPEPEPPETRESCGDDRDGEPDY
jgi:uncharacterized protein (DUF983 family)